MSKRFLTSEDYISAARRLRRRGMKKVSVSRAKAETVDSNVVYAYEAVAIAGYKLDDVLYDMQNSKHPFGFGIGSSLYTNAKTLKDIDPELYRKYEELMQLYSDLKAATVSIVEYADVKRQEILKTLRSNNEIE